MIEPFESRDHWVALADEVVNTLSRISGDEFFERKGAKYHPVREQILRLAGNIEVVNLEAWRAFLKRGGVGCDVELPAEPSAIADLDTQDVHFRLIKSLSNERWMDGVLVPSFKSRSLEAAIVRLRNDLGKLQLRTEPLF